MYGIKKKIGKVLTSLWKKNLPGCGLTKVEKHWPRQPRERGGPGPLGAVAGGGGGGGVIMVRKEHSASLDIPTF